MQLITAKCPDCGSDLKIPDESQNVTCEYCGANILVTDVLGSDAIMRNCMTLAYAAMQGKNDKDAYDNFNEALEQNSANYSAWYGKAICAGMLSTILDVRFNEMVVLFENAFKNVQAEKLPKVKCSSAAEIFKAAVKQKSKIYTAEQLIKRIKSKSQKALKTGYIGANTAKAKEEINNALIKAHEYDPSNNDVIELQAWVVNEIHHKHGFPERVQQLKREK